MQYFIRLQELKVFFYRIFLVYLFYSISRLFFLIYNFKLLKVKSISEYIALNYHGLAFDTTAIIYTNSLFILFSILPLFVNTLKRYQLFLFWLYFICNGIGLAANFVDFVYYKFTYTRTTVAIMDIVNNETNTGSLFFRFIGTYWHVFLLYFVTIGIWIFLYKRLTVKQYSINNKKQYILQSLVSLIVIVVLLIGGIRGDFKKSTRPITLVDASKFVTQPQHADIILNTPFTLIRTMGTNSFKEVKLLNQIEVDKYANTIKNYSNNAPSKPNVVVIITESYGREYIGAFNKKRKIKNYVSYTPFLDSLAQHSMIYTNAFANGSKSIHGMSSVLAGIPSFRDAFTSSPYPNQKIQSLVSCLKEKGYNTSFFHGAANGSMGFLGFSKILGFDEYYGRTEFNNDSEYDGSWGIWDEPFMQFMKQVLDKKQKPFFSTIFTVSSHEPFIPPAKYKDKFPKGNLQMHQVVGYTDFAFKKFFNEAKKSPWFKNTIFVITADHCNQTYYPFYSHLINRQAVPILIYKPGSDLKGENDDLAQQIDIYPTILDLIGYNKPFRSWGRSLFDKNSKPFVYNFNGAFYQLMIDDYICLFDGKNVVGIFKIQDYDFKNNLLNKIDIKEKEFLTKKSKAYLQDYMDRVVNKKLYIDSK